MACKYKYKDKWYSEIEVKNQLLKDISLNDVIVELSSQMSYTVEINTAKEQKPDRTNEGRFDETEGFTLNSLRYITDGYGMYITKNEAGDLSEISKKEYNTAKENFEKKHTKDTPTQHYSNLTVPGGINGSYREVNIESPLITLPKSHAQFNTKHTLMFSRMDDAQTYSEKDIEKLFSLMENNGQLEIKCN